MVPEFGIAFAVELGVIERASEDREQAEEGAGERAEAGLPLFDLLVKRRVSAQRCIISLSRLKRL